MGTITVLLTAVGCPGGPSVIRALQRGGCRVIGADMDPEASGRFFADEFHLVPHGGSSQYANALLDLCEQYRADVLFPQSSAEVQALACNQPFFEEMGVRVLVSEPDAVAVALDKWRTYQAIRGVVPQPLTFQVSGFHELETALGEVGLPAVLKPAIGKGGRGLRVIVEDLDRWDLDLRQWPNAYKLTVRELLYAAPMAFPPVLVQEYVEQDEDQADTYDGFGLAVGFTKIRQDCRRGVHFRHVAKFDARLMGLARQVIEALGLDYFVNVQFRGGKLLEANPRISTQIYHERFNLPLLGVRLALGDPGPLAYHLPDGTQSQYYHDLRSFDGFIGGHRGGS